LDAEIELVLDLKADLAEGPIWDPDRKRLVFVDIMRGYIHEFDPATREDRVTDVGRPVSAVALSVRGDWVAAAHGGFYRVNPDSGRVVPMAPVETETPENRMNDGYVDRAGRFWAGTMSMVKRRRAGSLYRLDPDGTVARKVTGVTTSNGLDWSLDGKLMYYVDTGVSRVDVFDFDETRGELSGRRPFVHVPALSGKPDGLIVDAEGFVWVALWNGGALHRYSPEGRLDRVLKLPAQRVTKCAFGGADFGDLYITTARTGLDAESAARQPLAGGLFRARPGVFGRPVTRFAA
jgi:sugar lactone lactonase YvrE